MFPTPCAVIAALFIFPSFPSVPHNLNFPAGGLAVRQVSAPPCLVQGAWPVTELGEPHDVTGMQRWGHMGQEELKKNDRSKM